MMLATEGVDVPIPDAVAPDTKDFWHPEGEGRCWVCGAPSRTAYLDIGWQHPDCDAYPDDDGHTIRIIRGHRVPDSPST